jgi:hypothetical protein
MYYVEMFSALAEAIETLDIPLHRDALVDAYELADRLTARLSAALTAYDAAGGPEADGCVNLAQWLRHYADRARRDAHHEAATARRLRDLPVVAARFADGTLSAGQVAGIVANLTDGTVAAFAEQEADMIPRLAALSAADTATVMRQWSLCAESLLDGTEPAASSRALYVSRSLDGRRELSGHLGPEGGAILETALGAATQDLEGDSPRTPAQRRADALVDLCRWFLDHQHIQPAGRHRPHVNLIVDLADFEAGGHGRSPDGTVFDPATTSHFACDSALHRVMVARGAILDYGTATRTVPTALWNALVVRDHACRIGGCNRPAAWCEAHHIQWVEHGGPTSMDNLILVCSRHHHLIHQRRWDVKLLPDGTVEVTLTDGHILVSPPPLQGRHPPPDAR